MARSAQPRAVSGESTRYTAALKAEIVLAIRKRRISRRRAMREHSLSLEELKSWEAAFDRGGVKALRVRALRR